MSRARVCPFEKDLVCSSYERLTELRRQADEAQNENKTVVFLTGKACAADAYKCIKLRQYRTQMRNKQK